MTTAQAPCQQKTLYSNGGMLAASLQRGTCAILLPVSPTGKWIIVIKVCVYYGNKTRQQAATLSKTEERNIQCKGHSITTVDT